MARAKGFQGIVGRKKAATWGTAVACASGDGIESVSLETPGNTTPIDDNQITGSITQRASTAGNRDVAVTLSTGLRYEGNEDDIALALGTAGVPATVDTSAKQHVLKPANQFDGIFATLAYELLKDVQVIEIPGVKWNTITLRGRAGERWMLELGGIGFDYVTGSVINTTTTIDTVTLPANREFAQFSQTLVELNDQTGADFGAGDALFCQGFEVTMDRGLAGRVSTEHGDKVSEPIENSGFAQVSGSLDFSEVSDVATGGNLGLIADQMALTEKKMKVTITSPNLAGSATQYFEHVLWFPTIQFGAGKPGIPGPEGQTWTLPFVAKHVAAVPTGFTAGYTQALIWENFNTRATDPLA